MGGPKAYLTNADPLPNALPYQALLDMAARGEVVQAQGFPDFMAADLHWIEPIEFGEEFERLANMGDNELADTPCSCDHCNQTRTLEQAVEKAFAEPAPWEDTTFSESLVGAVAAVAVLGLIWWATH